MLWALQGDHDIGSRLDGLMKWGSGKISTEKKGGAKNAESGETIIPCIYSAADFEAVKIISEVSYRFFGSQLISLRSAQG